MCTNCNSTNYSPFEKSTHFSNSKQVSFRGDEQTIISFVYDFPESDSYSRSRAKQQALVTPGVIKTEGAAFRAQNTTTRNRELRTTKYLTTHRNTETHPHEEAEENFVPITPSLRVPSFANQAEKEINLTPTSLLMDINQPSTSNAYQSGLMTPLSILPTSLKHTCFE